MRLPSRRRKWCGDTCARPAVPRERSERGNVNHGRGGARERNREKQREGLYGTPDVLSGGPKTSEDIQDLKI